MHAYTFGGNQPTVFFSRTKPAPANGTFLSQQISTNHQPQPAEQSDSKLATNKYYPSKPNSVPFTTEAKRATENARQPVRVGTTWNRIKQTNSRTKREEQKGNHNLDWDEPTNHAHRR